MAKKTSGRRTVAKRTRKHPGKDVGGPCPQESLHPVVAVLEERARAIADLGKAHRADPVALRQIRKALHVVMKCREMIAARACPPSYVVPFVAKSGRSPDATRRNAK